MKTPASPNIPGATALPPPVVPASSASRAFALMATFPLRFPDVTGFCPIGTPLATKGKFAGFTAVPFPAVPPDPKTFPFILNGPSSQSKPSSLRLFWLISTNFDSISTCFGCDAFAWSTRASTMSKLSCVLRTIRTPLCGQNVALAASARPSGRAMVGN